VDLLQQLPGVTFEESWLRRVTVDLPGGQATFIGVEDLLTNKRAVARPQDLRDVRAIERRRGTRGR
jgi:hypothetical protein